MENNVSALSLLVSMLNDKLRGVARLHSRVLQAKFSNSGLVKEIVKLYNSEHPITESDIKIVLSEQKVNGDALDKLISEFNSVDKLSQTGLEVLKDKFKTLVNSIILDSASKISDPVRAVDYIRNYDYEFRDENEISKKIKKYNFGDLNPDKVLEEFGEPIKSSVNAINDCFTLKGYQKHQLICVCAPPSVGKSLFLMNEAVKMINDGHRVCYIALGDLNEADFMIRCTSIGMGIPMNIVQLNLKKYWSGFISKMGSKLNNFGVFYIDADEITSKDLLLFIKDNQLDEKYNVFIVDYDTNFRSSLESMYAKGEEIYNDLSNLSKKVDLVFIASQPKIHAFTEELINMSDAAESGRKSQIVDVMITISKNQNAVGTQIGKINLAKVRRNGKSTHFCYMLNPSGAFIPISDGKYHAMESNTNPQFVPNKGVVNEGEGGELLDDLMKDIGV